MLYMFGFERYGIVLSDLYFVDPNPRPGQEGPERGVRLELRVLERSPLKGSIYSAQPIAVDLPIWRVDLLESANGPVGSFDRAHHHPALRDWEPGRRVFVDELSADPLGWLGAQLSDLPGVLTRAGVPPQEADVADAAAMRERVPEILEAVTRLLDGIKAGALATPRDGESSRSVRAGWL